MRRSLRIIGILVVVLVVAFFALRTFTKSNSPEAVAEVRQNGVSIRVDYCRPYKKGRVIFGGLVPYEKVWRTGANEATLIHLDQDVTIVRKPLKAGTYSLWSIPYKGGWVMVFNGETGQWGTQYDSSKDVLRVLVTNRKRNPPLEQFTIDFQPQVGGADMRLAWDDTEAVVPFRR